MNDKQPRSLIIIVGCGTLGSRVAHILKEQHLALIDHDVVYKHNLESQRFTRRDLGTQKVYALMRVLPDVRTHNVFLDQTNIDLLQEAEVVIDCTDNLLTRELIDWYCYNNGIPLVHAAAAKSRGIVGLFYRKPCLRSVYNKKISLENCRGSEINEQLADLLAHKQAQLAQEVLRGDEEHELHLVYPSGLEQITLQTTGDECEQELPTQDFYITWCPQAQCLSAKRLRPIQTHEQQLTVNGVPIRIQADGEIHFLDEQDIDILTQVAKDTYAKTPTA